MTRAPLRIALGGGGTDLPSYYERFGGFVLSAAIDKYVYVCLNRPASDDLIRVKYSKYEEVSDVADIQHDLVRPALELLDVRSNIEIVSFADVPAGTGLGSSSTYLVALLSALHELKRERIPPQALAAAAVHVEMELAHHPVGKQDHYLAAFGGITSLEIDRDGTVAVSPLGLQLSTVEELQRKVRLFYTGRRRDADAILAQQQADSVNDDDVVLDSLHTTKEIGLAIKDALLRGEPDEFGRLMHEHWEAKKRRSDKISDPSLDRCYDIARDAGALGGKIVGAGGGGFLMVYCPDAHRADIRARLEAEGLRETPFRFDFEGAKVLVNF